MKFAHISLFKEHDAAGYHAGGVEQFGHYLQMAIPEMGLIGFWDYPAASQCQHLADYERAEILNGWLLDQGILGPESTVVVDGYWGLGLVGHVKRVVSVCHGTYFGRFMQSLIYPWGEPVLMDQAEAQQEMWTSDGVEVIAVCFEVQNELGKLDIDSQIIRHGVPLDVFRPIEGPRDVWLHGAGHPRKGNDILSMMAQIDPSFECEQLGECPTAEDKVERFAHAKALLAPTRHEGNSYLLIEALACGVPLITYATGLACEMDIRCGLVTDDFSEHQFLRMIHDFDDHGYAARNWAEEHCDFGLFAAEWREYLGVE